MSDEDLYLSEAVMEVAQAEQKLKETYKDIKEYKSENMNIDLMAGLLIDLPYNIYIKNIELFNTTDKISLIKKKTKIIEDNVSQDINKIEELKNQAQRDSEQRRQLLGNETYQLLERATSLNERIKGLLQAQSFYYENLFSSIKIRYRQATAVLINDRKLQEAIAND